MLYLGGKGDAAIRYWEITNEEPFVHALSEFRDIESTKGGCFLPKALCDTTKCEVAICYRVMKDWISPVSFQVPRKSEMFQGDIFPDTYAGRPSSTADEYAAGTNKAPLKRSMKPGAAQDAKAAATNFMKADAKAQPAAAPAAQNAPAPSADTAQLQKDLDIAHARIKELEAENAKLKAAAAASSAPS